VRPFVIVVLATLLLVVTASARGETTDVAYISIIIDDLGYSWKEARRVTRLPGPVACAILPHTRFGKKIARLARQQGKEVLLHLPMESSQKDKDAGPGKLDSTMSDLEIRITIDYGLETVPDATGINNHMGSLLTQSHEYMDRLMRVIQKKKGFFFVDSLTSPRSVAAQAARNHGLPHLVRDIFLDNTRDEQFIEKQFDRLLQLAHQRKHVLAIGHPYPETIAVLERRLPVLGKHGIKLTSLSSMLDLTQQEPKL